MISHHRVIADLGPGVEPLLNMNLAKVKVIVSLHRMIILDRIGMSCRVSSSSYY